MQRFILPPFPPTSCFLVTEERVCHVRGNINHSAGLACLSESCRISTLPLKTQRQQQNNDSRGKKKNHTAFSPTAASAPGTKKKDGGGRKGRCGSLCRPLKKKKKTRGRNRKGWQGRKLPLASVSCFLQIATSRNTCGPHIDLPCGKMFQFLSGLVFLCHPGFKDFPSFCAFPPFPPVPCTPSVLLLRLTSVSTQMRTKKKCFSFHKRGARNIFHFCHRRCDTS